MGRPRRKADGGMDLCRKRILKYETGKKVGDLSIKLKKETILDKVNGDSLYIKISPADEKMRIQLKSNSYPTYTIDN